MLTACVRLLACLHAMPPSRRSPAALGCFRPRGLIARPAADPRALLRRACQREGGRVFPSLLPPLRHRLRTIGCRRGGTLCCGRPLLRFALSRLRTCAPFRLRRLSHVDLLTAHRFLPGWQLAGQHHVHRVTAPPTDDRCTTRARSSQPPATRTPLRPPWNTMQRFEAARLMPPGRFPVLVFCPVRNGTARNGSQSFQPAPGWSGFFGQAWQFLPRRTYPLAASVPESPDRMSWRTRVRCPSRADSPAHGSV